jgi:hypothetical protein
MCVDDAAAVAVTVEGEAEIRPRGAHLLGERAASSGPRVLCFERQASQ